MSTVIKMIRRIRFGELIAGVIIVLVGAAIALPVYGGINGILSPNPTQQYMTTYTDKGKCLHDTAYDPSKGAFITTLQEDGNPNPVLAVIPRDANFESPSVLFFTVVDRQQAGAPNLLGADHLVESFMYQKCGVDLR